jgi:thioredoxin 1
MATTQITSTKDFTDQIRKEGILLVDFWAAWCGPCRMFGPIFQKASEKHADLTFAKVDTEAAQELAGALGIRSIPTLMVFRDGILVFNQPGALPLAALEDLIGQVRALDMVKVRKEVEAEPASATG